MESRDERPVGPLEGQRDPLEPARTATVLGISLLHKGENHPRRVDCTPTLRYHDGSFAVSGITLRRGVSSPAKGTVAEPQPGLTCSAISPGMREEAISP